MSIADPSRTATRVAECSPFRSGLIGVGWFVALLAIGFGYLRWDGDRPLVETRADLPEPLPDPTSPDAPASTSLQGEARLLFPGEEGEEEVAFDGPERRPLPRQTLDAPDPVVPLPRKSSFPEAITLRDPLTVSADITQTATVDSPVSLALTIRNETSYPAEDVRVHVHFAGDWKLPGATEETVERRLGEIDAGRTRDVNLVLAPLRRGRQCVDVEVLTRTHETTSQTFCTDVGERVVELDVSGPARRTVGSRAEYIVTLRNVADGERDENVVTVNYASSLILKELSTGAMRQPGRLKWDLGALLNQERVQIQLEFECGETSDDACLETSVAVRGETVTQRTDCVSIVERPLLDVQVTDEVDPISVGETAVFLVRLHNRSSLPVEDIEFFVDLSPQLALESVAHGGRIELTGSDGESPVVRRRTPLAPGASAEYVVRAAARSAGDAELSTLVQADALEAPLEVRETLVVNPTVSAGE